jgi:hypothetical protein
MIEHVGEREDSEELGISLSFSLHLLTRRSSRERERECVILTTKSESCCARVCVCISTWSIYWTQTERERERESEREEICLGIPSLQIPSTTLSFFLSYVQFFFTCRYRSYRYMSIDACPHFKIDNFGITIYNVPLWLLNTQDGRPTDRPSMRLLSSCGCTCLIERERVREKSLCFDGFECALFLLGKQALVLAKANPNTPQDSFLSRWPTQAGRTSIYIYIYIYKIHFYIIIIIIIAAS